MTFTTGNVTISLPMGKAVGGTTVVSSGTCFRAPEWILAKWGAEYGVGGTDADSMAPYFAQAEEILNVTPVPDEVLGTNGETLKRGAEALGWSSGPIPRNIRGCHGSGECAFGCPRDAKQSMQLSYLPMAVAAGARIYAPCRGRRGRAAGRRGTGGGGALPGPPAGRGAGRGGDGRHPRGGLRPRPGGEAYVFQKQGKEGAPPHGRGDQDGRRGLLRRRRRGVLSHPPRPLRDALGGGGAPDQLRQGQAE